MAVFGNSISSSVYRFDQVNTLISKFLVFGKLAFSLAF